MSSGIDVGEGLCRECGEFGAVSLCKAPNGDERLRCPRCAKACDKVVANEQARRTRQVKGESDAGTGDGI